MIDGLQLKPLMDLVSAFGLPGMMFIVWYFSEKSHERTINQYREDMTRTQAETRELLMTMQRRSDERFQEVFHMYENNVELVKVTQVLAGDHKDVVIMNAQTLTRLCDLINGNQYCPMIRLKKQAEGAQG